MITKIVEQSQAMLQYAKDEAWQLLEETHLEQTLLLHDFFDNLSRDITEKEHQDLLLVQQLSQIITKLLEKNKADVSGQLLKLKHGQLKAKSYQENP